MGSGGLRPILMTTTAVVYLLAATSAHADSLQDARRALTEGRYKDAKSALQPLAEKGDDVDAKLLLAQIEAETGEYSHARLLVDRALARMQRNPTAAALTLKARLQAHAGAYEPSLATYKKAVEAEPGHVEARLRHGLLLLHLGRTTPGKKDLDALVDELAESYNNGVLDSDATGLMWLGVGLRHLQLYDDANEALTEATRVDPRLLEAWTQWGDLFLEKYNIPDARFAYNAALKVNPRFPPALVGLAQTHLESDNDHAKTQSLLDRALTTNPTLPAAILLKARLQIDDEDYPGAVATLKLALAINPNHLEAIALTGTAHYLADHPKKYEKARRRAFRINPKYAAFYTTVATLAARVHRYPEAIELNRKALQVEPAYWRAFIALGIGYTRIGDDAKGLEYLEKAHRNDPYNVRAYNMVNLYDDTLREYEFVERGKLRLRYHRQDRLALDRIVSPLAQEAFTALQRRYGYTPPHKTSVEVFRDVTTFSVRSVGVPHVSPHGICFGRVVTARSPREGNFNWAEVIWHEMAHVFHIQLSGHRVPRWFTEGLAEYEAGRARPEWRREEDLAVMAALRGNRLRGVAELNKGFTRAQSISEVIAAYYHATLVIEFIVERWGFKTIPKMLRLWGKKRGTRAVIKTATGLDIVGFNTDFEAWLRVRYATLLGTFEPWLGEFTDLTGMEEAARSSPDDTNAQARFAIALFVARRLDEAEAKNRAVLKSAPKNPHALFLAALLAQRSRAPKKSHGFLNDLIDAGHDGYTIRMTRADIARQAGLPQEAIDDYQAALAIWPSGVGAHRALADLYREAGKAELAVHHLEQVTSLDQNDFDAAHTLMQTHRKLGNDAEAFAAALRAANIRPFLPRLHQEMGGLALAIDELEQAVRAFETELAISHGGPEVLPSHLGLAQAHARLGKKKRARKALRHAEEAAPGHPDIAAARAELGL
jgi:tetratricopeptide (TPR) repeat protein